MAKKIIPPVIPDLKVIPDPKNPDYKKKMAKYIIDQYHYIENIACDLTKTSLFSDVDNLWRAAKGKFKETRQCECCGMKLTYNDIVERGYDFPSTYIKGCDILFVGINPSYNCKKKQTMPIEHPLCYGNKLHEYCGFNEDVNNTGNKLGTKKGTYWGAHLVSLLVGKEMNRYVSWSATDLFFVRETTQNWLLNYTGNNLGEWDEFLVAQAKIALKIVEEINPKVIVVANGGGREFIKKQNDLKGFINFSSANIRLQKVGSHYHEYDLGEITLAGQSKPIILVKGRFEGNDSIGSKNLAKIAQKIAELL